jgi:hypothetical protein
LLRAYALASQKTSFDSFVVYSYSYSDKMANSTEGANKITALKAAGGHYYGSSP